MVDLHVCTVHGYRRLSSQCNLFRSTPVEKFVLHSTKPALQNRHFSAQNALKLTYRHLGFQKFSRGDIPGHPLKGNGEGKERPPVPTPGLNPGYAYVGF